MEEKEYPNTGALFRTKEKKHEKAPDMWGKINLDKYYLINLIEESEGNTVEVKIDGWTNESKSGQKYLSLKVNTWKPEEQRVKQEAPKPPVDEDDIPF